METLDHQVDKRIEINDPELGLRFQWLKVAVMQAASQTMVAEKALSLAVSSC